MNNLTRPPGRPPLGKQAMRKRNIMLSDEHVRLAKAIGDRDGDENMSRGIRMALMFTMYHLEHQNAYIREYFPWLLGDEE